MTEPVPCAFPNPQIRRVVLTLDQILTAWASLDAFAALLAQHGFVPDRPIHWRWMPGTAQLTMTQLQEGDGACDDT